MNVGFAHIINYSKGRGEVSAKGSSSFKAIVQPRCLTRVRRESQEEASGLSQGRENDCVPFYETAGVFPGQALAGMQRS